MVNLGENWAKAPNFTVNCMKNLTCRIELQVLGSKGLLHGLNWPFKSYYKSFNDDPKGILELGEIG
jgi:hypothetical protein